MEVTTSSGKISNPVDLADDVGAVNWEIKAKKGLHDYITFSPCFHRQFVAVILVSTS